MRDPGRMSPASFFRFPNLPKDPETSVVREGPLRVGLVWAGNPLFANDRARSMNLEQLADLLVVAGVEWISLQRGEVAGRLSRTPAGCSITDAGSNLKDFGETAAVLADLDLLISTDTSVPHLAGAMNIPVWLMLSRIPDWRWGVEGTRTSWYPSMTLFRQPVRGDWRSVTSLVRDRLVERVGSLRQR